ncbi:exported protein [Mycobacterium pseudoshottsii JCM 15466]|nr:Sphingomyelinase [Mycobacterium pseudoshottsii]GAQ33587.1 exported protein [Mycobacterium pseudoshottsii JCM 15466]
MGYASHAVRVGALVFVLVVGAAVATDQAIGHAAPTDSDASNGESWADVPAPPGGENTAASLLPGAAQPGAVPGAAQPGAALPGTALPGAASPGVGTPQLDPSNIPDDLLNAVINFLASIRNGVVPILENRTPVATPQQLKIDVNGSTGLVPFSAYDPDGNRMTFKVNPRGTPWWASARHGEHRREQGRLRLHTRAEFRWHRHVHRCGQR